MGRLETKSGWPPGAVLIEALFSESRDILLLADSDLAVIKANLAAGMLFGRAARELEGRGADSLLDPEGGAGIGRIASRLRIDGETASARLRVRDYLGVERSLSATLRCVAGDDRDARLVLIALRESANPAAHSLSGLDSRLLIKRLLKGISDSVLLVDVKQRTICDCNLGAERMFGYERSEIVGRSPQFLAASEEQAKDYLERSGESFAKNGFFQDKMRCRRKDGSAFMTLATNLALFGASGELEFILAINRDITAEEKLLEEVFRLSEKSKLVLEALNQSIMPLQRPVPRTSLSSLGFSARQIEIANVLVAGEPTKIIADRLRISESAVKSHLSSMYRRLGVGSRVEFVKYMHNRDILME